MQRHPSRDLIRLPSAPGFRTLGATRVVFAVCGVMLTAAVGRLSADDETVAPENLRTFVVQADFSNGNGRLESLDQRTRTIRLSPTEHKQRGWACWWYVKVTGIRPGETVTLNVGKAPWATPARAAYSLDNQNWLHTNLGTRQQDRIVYRQRIDASTAWFAWGPPFTGDDARALTAWAAATIPETEQFELGRTRGGQPIPAIRVGGPLATKATATLATAPGPMTAPGPASAPTSAAEGRRYGIWIQARQHAWEAGSSWVCKGLVNWLGSEHPRAASLRAKSQLVIVPIMDIDNVALGAGGKNQAPHDHNRDWSDQPHWPAVRAASAEISRLDRDGRFDVFVDLHNPGPGNDEPFFFTAPRELLTDLGQRNLRRLLATSQTEITGPLALAALSRESGPTYDKAWRRISKNWVTFNTRDHVVAVTLETTWNSPHATAAGYETVGRQLGLALERYLRTDPRQKD